MRKDVTFFCFFQTNNDDKNKKPPTMLVVFFVIITFFKIIRYFRWVEKLKIIFIVIFIPLGLLSCMFWLVGHHGAIVFFRPHMVEDWFIWGFMLLGVIGVRLAFTFKKKKYDIDFSDENIAKLKSSIESICEFLDKNETWNFIKDFEAINESALDYDYNKFRESTINPALVGTMNSINDGIFSDSKIENEFKAKFKKLLEIIIQMGHNHPRIISTYKLL